MSYAPAPSERHPLSVHPRKANVPVCLAFAPSAGLCAAEQGPAAGLWRRPHAQAFQRCVPRGWPASCRRCTSDSVVQPPPHPHPVVESHARDRGACPGAPQECARGNSITRPLVSLPPPHPHYPLVSMPLPLRSTLGAWATRVAGASVRPPVSPLPALALPPLVLPRRARRPFPVAPWLPRGLMAASRAPCSRHVWFGAAPPPHFLH
ncbi:MAG: hypothetical protein J3K34DRAFT_422793 [Monoraphidium minutum]|nr:MAG: hypothetical protein J3K34DRAFT_422793 [Monoraphidium minutum]